MNMQDLMILKKYMENGLILIDENAMAIVDRAIAAEAKLAEIEKQEPAVAVPDDVVEALWHLGTTNYKRWKSNPAGFVGGNIQVSQLVKVVEFARELLSTPTPSAEQYPTTESYENELAEKFIGEQPDSAAPNEVTLTKLISLPCTHCGNKVNFAHQRITEQDAREIAMDAIQYYSHVYGMDCDEWMINGGRTLLSKLNEHREPDYKAQRDELIEHLYTALPFVEDAEFNEGGKPKRVADIVKSIRASIASTSTSTGEK